MGHEKRRCERGAGCCTERHRSLLVAVAHLRMSCTNARRTCDLLVKVHESCYTRVASTILGAEWLLVSWTPRMDQQCTSKPPFDLSHRRDCIYANAIAIARPLLVANRIALPAVPR